MNRETLTRANILDKKIRVLEDYIKTCFTTYKGVTLIRTDENSFYKLMNVLNVLDENERIIFSKSMKEIFTTSLEKGKEELNNL